MTRGDGFSFHGASGRKFLSPNIDMAEGDVDDEFSVPVAIIIAKDKLKTKQIISATCMPVSNLEQSSVLYRGRNLVRRKTT